MDASAEARLDDPAYLRRRYVTDGLSLKRLAAEIGCSTGCLAIKLAKQEISPPDGRCGKARVAAPSAEDLSRDYERLGSVMALAEHLGRSRHWVTVRLAEIGIDTSDTPKWKRVYAENARRAAAAKATADHQREARNERLREMRQSGMSAEEIARRTGHAAQTVRNALAAAGMETSRQVTPAPPCSNPDCKNRITHRRQDGLCAICSGALIYGSNRASADATAQRTVGLARSLLAAGVTSKVSRETLQARVEYPNAALSELAAILGVTKDQFAGRLRRALNSRG